MQVPWVEAVLGGPKPSILVRGDPPIGPSPWAQPGTCLLLPQTTLPASHAHGCSVPALLPVLLNLGRSHHFRHELAYAAFWPRCPHLQPSGYCSYACVPPGIWASCVCTTSSAQSTDTLSSGWCRSPRAPDPDSARRKLPGGRSQGPRSPPPPLC